MSNTIFDSHCHPNFPSYDEDREEMLKRAKEAGVFMICVGTDLETSKSSIELASKQNNMWATVGLHPNDNLDEKFNTKEYEELFKMPKVVAMGEIGLDYYRTEKPEDQKFQKERFIEQLELAKKLNKPLVLHCRDSKAGSLGRSYQDMLDILPNFSLPGVLHSYTGSLDEVKKFLDRGLCIGFNGIITFARQYDEVVKYVPLERILLETDSPFLTPVPHRGKRNEPAYVVEVGKKLAELKNESFEKVIEQTTQNCRTLFGI